MNFDIRLIAAVMLLVPAAAYSLPDDRSQPIEIQANSAERDAKTGVTTYSGNVDINQGSIHISANRVVLDSKNNELSQITASGAPATYTQQLTGPEDVVDAKADTIYFDVAKNLITLQGGANLKQPSGSITGDHIEYDTKNERVRAQASESGSSDNTKRITVIIPPAQKQPSAGKTTTGEKSKP